MELSDIESKINSTRIVIDEFRWEYLSKHFSMLDIPQLNFNSLLDKWQIVEAFKGNPPHLIYERNKLSLDRKTVVDDYSCIGLSSVAQRDSVILTEGVSDYFTAFLLFKDTDLDVLGLTKLGGNNFSKSFILSVYKNIFIIADNDGTGIKNASNMSMFYKSYGKKVKIIIPQAKDLTDQVLIYE